MKCIECSAEMHGPTSETTSYTCGLPDVYLVNVPVWRCPNCGDVEVEIENVEGLHEELTRVVLQKPRRLSPEEIRFLREARGWSSTMAARTMGVALATWSRWENGKAQMSESMERLLRLLVKTNEPVTEYEDVKNDSVTMRFVGHGWATTA